MGKDVPPWLGLGAARRLPWDRSECSLPLVPWSRPKPARRLPFSPCPSCRREKEHPASAPRGAGCGRGCRRGGERGLQCAGWTHEGSKTLREKRDLRRGGRGLVTKGTPTQGFSQTGGRQFPGLLPGRLIRCFGRRQARCLPREGPIALPSWDQGSPQAPPGSIAQLRQGSRNGAVQMGNGKVASHWCGLTLEPVGALLGLLYAWPSAPSQSRSVLGNILEGGLFWQFSLYLRARPLYVAHNPHQASQVLLMAQRGLNVLFSAPKVESTLPLAR